MTTLYYKNKKETQYTWKGWTEGSNVLTEYGTSDGKKQIASFACEAKNVGKSNETTPEQQAILELNSIIEDKLKKKYKRTLEETEEFTFGAMLASQKKFADYKDKLEFPIYGQPKFDGLRCLAHWNEDRTEILMMSRGKEYFNSLPHITDELKKILPHDAFLDGELYIHGEILENINSFVKKYQEGLTEQVQYYTYDFVKFDNFNEEYEERLENIKNLYNSIDKSPQNLVKVFTVALYSLDEVEEYDRENLKRGFEGSMLRKAKGKYTSNQRSNDLLRVKRFQDAEFKVIGYSGGKGKNLKCVTWTCETLEGKPFTCTMNVPVPKQKKFLKEAEQYLGKMLTVKFFNYTGEGKPFLPKGLVFRLEEDLDKK